MKEPTDTESRHFADDGATPNNPTLPLVLMRRTAAAEAEDPTAWFEEAFESHGWGATWRWRVYDYHHFHTTNHEVLGVSAGRATLLFGGEKGTEFHVSVGDVIVLPAGTGHKSLSHSQDFQVVGAYPRGEKPDLIRSGEGDMDAARSRIAAVALPAKDPVHGADGPLHELWRS